MPAAAQTGVAPICTAANSSRIAGRRHSQAPDPLVASVVSAQLELLGRAWVALVPVRQGRHIAACRQHSAWLRRRQRFLDRQALVLVPDPCVLPLFFRGTSLQAGVSVGKAASGGHPCWLSCGGFYISSWQQYFRHRPIPRCPRQIFFPAPVLRFKRAYVFFPADRHSRKTLSFHPCRCRHDAGVLAPCAHSAAAANA